MLVSASFIASEYCWGVEVKAALERHERGEARIIPVILRPCRWCIAPFASLQAAPKDGKAATEWPNIHSAFDDVASRIERVLIELRRAEEAQRKADVERRRAEEEARRRAEEREDKRRAEGKAPATVDEVVAPHKQPESGPQPERSNPDRFSIPRTCPRCGGTGKVDYSFSGYGMGTYNWKGECPRCRGSGS